VVETLPELERALQARLALVGTAERPARRRGGSHG